MATNTNPKNKEKTKRTKWTEARFLLLSQYCFYKTQGLFDDVKTTNATVWQKIASDLKDEDDILYISRDI